MIFTIAFYVNGLPFDGDTLKHSSLGGSETAGLCMARELVKLGHKVVVFSNCKKPGVFDGVSYFHISQWDQYSTTIPHDISIIQRQPGLFARRLSSKINILWNHDLALGRHADQFRGALWNIDAVTVLSNYMLEQYQSVYKLKGEPLWKTRNGIDLELFPSTSKRDKKKLIYTARPERGLDNLVNRIFPKMLKRDPGLKLYIAAYHNVVNELQAFYQHIETVIAQHPNNIINLGSLTKEQLYKHYSTASCYLYPTPSVINKNFAEVSCITAMECQAAGLPIVAHDVGALGETIHQDAGTLIEGFGFDESTDDAFIDAVFNYLEDDKLYTIASEAGRSFAKELSWSSVAKEWDDKFHTLFQEKNKNPERLGLHLLKHSNYLNVNAPSKPGNPKLLEEKTKQYEMELKKPKEDIKDYYDQAGNEKRLQTIKSILKKINPESVLDFGCASGVYAIHCSNDLPDTKFHCFDNDNEQLAQMTRNIKKYSKYRFNIHKYCSNHLFSFENDLPDETYEVGIIAEVLEHNADYCELITKVEAKVKTDGLLIITVPHGPWEHGNPRKEHVIEFEYADLKEMFGNKPGFQISYMNEGVNVLTGDPLGWHLVTYKADHKPIGNIDLKRKYAQQVPRQTVSACILAGPGCESTLRWSIESYANIVDEILVSDCGLSDEAKKIFNEFGAKIFSAPNPKIQGFDRARNETLQHASCDWVLWIDTDERLTDSQNLTKYFRENIYNGYGIRQNHFAVDAQFNPDIPVRLFRRDVKTKDGDTIKFYGRIHEHPEFKINEGVGELVILTDVQIAHIGYVSESVRQSRFWRNLPLLKKDIADYPDRLLQKHFICRDNMQLSTYHFSKNGNVVTEEIKKYCNETIEIYRKYFLGKVSFVNIDTKQYYSKALEFLGLGIDGSFQAKFGPAGSIPGAMRYASKEDLQKDLSVELDKSDQYFEKWY